MGENLKREYVNATVWCGEDSKYRVIGISVIEDDCVKLVGSCPGWPEGRSGEGDFECHMMLQ